MNSGALEILKCKPSDVYSLIFHLNDHLLKSALETFGSSYSDQNYHSSQMRNYIPIASKVMTFGRLGTDFIIDQPTVSGVHFIIWGVMFDDNTDPLYYLKDMSLNGTLVNGVLVGKNMVCLLNDNDRISINFSMRFRFIQLPINDGSKVNPGVYLFNRNKASTNWTITNKVIGQGSFGSVHMAVNNQQYGCNSYAVKIIRSNIQLDMTPRVKQEADILLKINHVSIPFLLQDLHFLVYLNSS